MFNVDRCKNLPLSNRLLQTLGSYSMSSAPPLPATKKERSKYFPELETVNKDLPQNYSIRRKAFFQCTKTMPRQSPPPKVIA